MCSAFVSDAFLRSVPHTVPTHQPANGIIKEGGSGPWDYSESSAQSPFMGVPDSIGCGEKRKGDEWPQFKGLRYLTLFLSRGGCSSLEESAAGALSHDELRNSRMSLDKCLLDK